MVFGQARQCFRNPVACFTQFGKERPLREQKIEPGLACHGREIGSRQCLGKFALVHGEQLGRARPVAGLDGVSDLGGGQVRDHYWMRLSGRNRAPGGFDFTEQRVDFAQRFGVVVGIGGEQAALRVVVQRLQAVGDFAAGFEV